MKMRSWSASDCECCHKMENEPVWNRMWITCQQREREEEQKDGLRLIGSVGRGSEQFWKCDRLGAGSCQLPHWDYMCVTDGLLGRGKIHKPGDPGASRTISIISNDANANQAEAQSHPMCTLHTMSIRWWAMEPAKETTANFQTRGELLCYFFQAPAGNNTQ